MIVYVFINNIIIQVGVIKYKFNSLVINYYTLILLLKQIIIILIIIVYFIIVFCFSAFWLTNETINIWSHVFGWMLFFGLTIYDLFLLNIHASSFDKLVVGLLLGCFQVFTQQRTNINPVIYFLKLELKLFQVYTVINI